jgi:phospholipid/cholesterol/gamma-HCH transport system substrate-binding protein
MFDAKKELRWSKLKVGLVITVAIFLLLVGVFFAGNIREMFFAKIELKAEFQDVRGLRRGAPVWIFGTEVGTVKEIHLAPVHGAIVTISVNKDILPFLKKDSQASILTMGLLGDKYIELNGGSAQAGPLQPGETIKGSAQVQFSNIMETVSAAIGKIGDFVNKLDNLVTEIEEEQGTVSKLFKDPALYDNLKNATQTLSLLMENIKNSQGTLKRLVEDPSLYNKALASVSNLEEFSKKLNESSGTLKKVIENPELYNNLDKASSKLNSILEGIEKGKGPAGALVKDEELVTEVKNLLVEFKKLSVEIEALAKDIKENPKKYFKFSVF